MARFNQSPKSYMKALPDCSESAELIFELMFSKEVTVKPKKLVSSLTHLSKVGFKTIAESNLDAKSKMQCITHLFREGSLGSVSMMIYYQSDIYKKSKTAVKLTTSENIELISNLVGITRLTTIDPTNPYHNLTIIGTAEYLKKNETELKSVTPEVQTRLMPVLNAISSLDDLIVDSEEAKNYLRDKTYLFKPSEYKELYLRLAETLYGDNANASIALADTLGLGSEQSFWQNLLLDKSNEKLENVGELHL